MDIKSINILCGLLNKLNPHHKALIFTLIELNKLNWRELARDVVGECINLNNKWNKDWYIWVLTYMIVQTIKTNFDTGTKDLVDTVQKLIDYPIQPLKNTSIRTLFPDKIEEPSKVKPIKRSPVSFKVRKLANNPGEKPASFKKSFTKPANKSPEDIFDQKLRIYRENIRKQQIINGLEPNAYGNWKTLKYALGSGNNSILLQHALSSRWWWYKVKIKDNNYNFLWTQLKSKRFISMLKKHTEACVTEQNNSIMTPDLTKNFDTDLEASKTNESSEDTVATPSSSKHAQRRLLYERNQKKQSWDIVLNKRKIKQKTKPPMLWDSTNLSNHLESHIHLSNK